MSPRDKELLLREFAAWAREQRLSTHRHDAQFHGRFRDTPIEIEIETGIRDSDLYKLVATIYFACGQGTMVLRDGDARPDDSPLVSSLRAVMRDARGVLSIRLDDAIVTVRMQPGSRPVETGEVLDAVLSAIQSLGAAVGPYR